MNAESAARVGVRLLSIWFFVSALSGLAGVGSIDTNIGGYGAAVALIVGATATQIAAAAVAWKYAPWLAARICSTGAEPLPSREWSPASAAQGAVGVVGVFMLSEALPQALWFIVALAAAKLIGPSPLSGQPAYDAQMGLYTVGGIANAAAVLARVIVGMLLVLRASTVSTLILEADRTPE
jgi:hypothetical protein